MLFAYNNACNMYISDKDRKFRVVVNGCMSDEAEVLSGVPQGTVLAALFFVIMISNIDENIKKTIARSFADDTSEQKNQRPQRQKGTPRTPEHDV